MIEISLLIISILAIVTLEGILIFLFVKHFKDISNSFERRDKKYVEINKELKDINSELIKLNSKIATYKESWDNRKESDETENLIKKMENIIKTIENNKIKSQEFSKEDINKKALSDEKENSKGLDIDMLRKRRSRIENLNDIEVNRKQDNVKSEYEKMNLNNSSGLINQERMEFNSMDNDLSEFTINKSYKTHIITKKEVNRDKKDSIQSSNKDI